MAKILGKKAPKRPTSPPPPYIVVQIVLNGVDTGISYEVARFDTLNMAYAEANRRNAESKPGPVTVYAVMHSPAFDALEEP
jgi:hypothetical protein